MTKEDITKALETCSKDEDCDKCPYCNHYYCDRALLKDALVLITKQESEIEQLKADNEKRLTCDFVKTAQKHAQVDILNKVKVLIFQKDNPYDVPFEAFVGANVFCGYIDDLIKEIEQ